MAMIPKRLKHFDCESYITYHEAVVKASPIWSYLTEAQWLVLATAWAALSLRQKPSRAYRAIGMLAWDLERKDGVHGEFRDWSLSPFSPESSLVQAQAMDLWGGYKDCPVSDLERGLAILFSAFPGKGMPLFTEVASILEAGVAGQEAAARIEGFLQAVAHLGSKRHLPVPVLSPEDQATVKQARRVLKRLAEVFWFRVSAAERQAEGR